MTGGVGFSKDANNALKKNKDLRGSRKRNAQNPYWGLKKPFNRKTVNLSELINWKKHRVATIDRRSTVTFLAMGLIVIVLWGYFLF